MKALALVLLMAMSGSLFADSTVTERVWFDGQNESDVVNMSTEKTRTEYRTVTVPATCWRTEYRYRCHWAPGHCRTICRRGGSCQRVCSPGRRICRNYPERYPYPCERQVTESYEVFDHYVNTTVNLDYDLEGILNGAGEEFVVSVTGEKVSLGVNDSKDYVVLKRKTESSARMEGDTLEQTKGFKLSFVPAELVVDTLGNGIQNVRLNRGVLTFALGKNFNTKDFVQNLKIYNSRRFAPDKLLLDKDLNEAQMDVSAQGNLKVVTVDLRTLGVNLPSRMRVIMTTTFDPKGAEVMNADSFKLEASSNWIFSK